MLKSMLDRVREAHAAELEGEEAAEAGFTLIELMVVLLIIAILLAIAIPTFLGVTSSANDRAAQSNLTNALTEAATQYQNLGQQYSPNLVSTLQTAAPEFQWTSGSCTATTTNAANCMSVAAVSVNTTGDAQGVMIADISKQTNTCWYVLKLETSPASTTQSTPFSVYGAASTGGTFYAKGPSSGGCTASSTGDVTGHAWANSYTSAS